MTVTGIRESRGGNGDADGIQKRLDAIIRLLLEISTHKGTPLELGDAIRALCSAGLTPSEIGKILGKKTTDIAWALYGSKSTRRRK